MNLRTTLLLSAALAGLAAAPVPAAELGIRFTQQFVPGAAAHAVDGNRFAYAGDVVAATLAGTLARHTALYEVGAQFSF